MIPVDCVIFQQGKACMVQFGASQFLLFLQIFYIGVYNAQIC